MDDQINRIVEEALQELRKNWINGEGFDWTKMKPWLTSKLTEVKEAGREEGIDDAITMMQFEIDNFHYDLDSITSRAAFVRNFRTKLSVEIDPTIKKFRLEKPAKEYENGRAEMKADCIAAVEEWMKNVKEIKVETEAGQWMKTALEIAIPPFKEKIQALPPTNP